MHVQLSDWLFAHVSAIKSRQSGQAGEVDAKGGGGSRGSEQWGGRAYFFNRRPVKRLTTGTEGTQLWTMKFDNDDDYDDDVVACCCKLNRFCSTERPRDLRLSLQHCSFPLSRPSPPAASPSVSGCVARGLAVLPDSLSGWVCGSGFVVYHNTSLPMWLAYDLQLPEPATKLGSRTWIHRGADTLVLAYSEYEEMEWII